MQIAKRLLLLALACASVLHGRQQGRPSKARCSARSPTRTGRRRSARRSRLPRPAPISPAATTTNADGNYVFSNIKEGVYRVETSLKGFKKVARENVQVDVNTTVRVDLVMQVGEVSETVTIDAGVAPTLQTDRADTGRLIETKQVAELPLGFGRNFQGLLVTVPGATRPARPHSEFFNPQDSLESKVNGQSRMSNNFMIEGVDNNEKTGLLQVLIPAADAIETVSISTSNFDAELGRAGGAVSSVTLKSGTNDIHGSAFFFGNNENTIAKDYFSSLTPNFSKPLTRYRQVGFTIGGPIIKNKLFYFGDYQYTSDKLGKVGRAVIPIVAMAHRQFQRRADHHLRSVHRKSGWRWSQVISATMCDRPDRTASARLRIRCSPSSPRRTSPAPRSDRTTSSSTPCASGRRLPWT